MTEQTVPNEFKQIYVDFTRDLTTTFPEISDKLVKEDDLTEEKINEIFEYCKKIMPERFFDILYKNADIFQKEEINTKFLPEIDFKELWNCDDISDNTRNIIWKYLQLIMFSIIETIRHQDSFGDAAKLFEAIDENELKSKLQESIDQMQTMFNEVNSQTENVKINTEDLPDPTGLHDHLNNIMGGKLGKMAHEIAEETVKDFDFDIGEETNVGDIFQKLFKNPGKLMNVVNNISKKLDNKLNSGEVNETELMKEAGDLMSQMKNIPGMPNIQDLLQNMNNMTGQQRGMMQQKMNLNDKLNTQKERLQKKLEERRRVAQEQQTIDNTNKSLTNSNNEVSTLSAFTETPKPHKVNKKKNKNKKR